MKKKGILLLIGILFIIPTIVFAAKASVTTDFEGVITAKPGDIVAYDIKITTDELKPTKYKANLEYNKDVVEFKSITQKGEGWSSISSENSIELNNSKGASSGTIVVATITFKVKDDIPKQNTEIKLTNIQITTLDDEKSESITNLDDKKVTLSIKSTDNKLKDLKVDGITLEEFKEDVFEYELEVSSEEDKIEIKATPNNVNATFVEGYGPRTVDVNYGENEFLIKVKSESGEIQVYKISIKREDDRNTNNSLKEVIINSGKIKLSLSKNQVDYEVKTYKLKELEVDAVAVDPKAKVEVKLPEEIIVGDNIVVISVTSESGEEKLYTITFSNSDTEIDTKIKTLYIKEHDIDFDKNTMVYEVVFNKKFKKGLDIRVVPVSGDDLVNYQIYYNGNLLTEDTKVNLKAGDKYEIKVIPIGMEEGNESETSTYTITIVKDTRISFYLVLEAFIALILVILIIVQIVKRNKIKKSKTKKEIEKTVSDKKVKTEIEKTKVMTEEEINKINDNKE